MALSAAQEASPQAAVLIHGGMIHPSGAFAKGGEQNCKQADFLPTSRRPQPLGLGPQKEISVGKLGSP